MSPTATVTKENALLYPHIRWLRFFMWSLGAWPRKALGECAQLPLPYRCYMKLLVLASTLCTLGEFHYLYQFSKELSYTILGMCVTTTFLAIITLVRASVTNLEKYGEVLERFFMSFHLANFKHRGGFHAKMHETVYKLSHYFSLYSISMMVVAGILFNVSPMYPNYKNGVYTGSKLENVSYVFTIYYSFPGFNPNDWFILVTMINSSFSYLCAVLVCGIDLLLYLIVFQIVGHILILRNSLSEFPMPQTQCTMTILDHKSKSEEVVAAMFDEEENVIIHQRLVDCIEHHKLIVSFTKDVSDFFGPVLAVTYGMHLMSCCLLLLECTKGDTGTIISFVPLTVNIFVELIQISVIFEVVGTVVRDWDVYNSKIAFQSEKLKDSVYETPWECMNIRNRRTVYIFLQRVQTPILVTALGTVPIGVVTMAGILKTTFSYFAFLQSFE